MGASGKTGRRVVQRLAGAGLPYRPAGRSTPEPFVWEQPSSWGAVLAGAGSAYVVHPELAATGAATLIGDFAAAAAAAGVAHLVLLSGRGEQGAIDSEQAVRESGVSHTIVRAGWFAQNYTEGLLLPGVLDGSIILPAGDVAEPVVDADDIADVAFAALTDPRHAGRTYEVTGARSLTFTEMAAVISAASGRRVSFVDAPPAAFRSGLATLVGDAQAAMFTALLQEIFDGRNEKPGTGVVDALGREPRDFTAFCHAAAGSGAW
ncbi:NmrA family transcriptional regulator [Actinoplanes sp. OR16]|nr:NmrA family transcriptional regulator [Actinoplanes sp. OR16]